MAAPGAARAAQCGLPDVTPLWVEYAEGTLPPPVRTLFARPGLVLAGSGVVLSRQQREAGAQTVHWYMHLRAIVGTPSEPTDPAGVSAAADALVERAIASSACATPLIALNELSGASLPTPWSATNAQYRANVLALMDRLAVRGARPFLLLSSAPYVASDEAVAWWRAAARSGDLVREVYFSAPFIGRQGAIVGSRTRRIAMRKAVETFTSLGIPVSRIGLMLGFQTAPGNGGREGMERLAWLQIVKREALAAKAVAAELEVATVWSWGWGVFGPESEDADKPAAACVYLWARDSSLCDGPAAAGEGFNVDLAAGQNLLAAGVQCSVAGRPLETASLAALTALTGDRQVAFTALLARLAQGARATVAEEEIAAGEDSVVRGNFGGSIEAYLAELGRRGVGQSLARELIADDLRRERLSALLQAEGSALSVADWTIAEGRRLLGQTICLRDELPVAGTVELTAAYLPFLRPGSVAPPAEGAQPQPVPVATPAPPPTATPQPVTIPAPANAPVTLPPPAAPTPVPSPAGNATPASAPRPPSVASAAASSRPRLVVVSPRSVLPVARAGKRFSVGVRVVRNDTGRTVTAGKVRCTATLAGRRVALVTSGFRRGVATCAWRLPARSAGKLLRGSVGVSAARASVRRAFARRIR